MKTLTALALAAAGIAWTQVAKEANERYKTPEGRKSVAAGLSRPDRDAEQKPKELVETMGVKPGMTVADIGSGAGYMLPWLSRAVGPSGKVYAQDIFDDFLEKAKATAAREKLTNVEFFKGTETAPNLPAGSVDIALALDSYHHYDYPEKMLAGIHEALKPGGRLVIVEFYKRPGAMRNGNAMNHIRLDAADVIKEIEANQFHFLAQREHTKGSQYMAIFEKR